jgi:hypothetical protein
VIGGCLKALPWTSGHPEREAPRPRPNHIQTRGVGVVGVSGAGSPCGRMGQSPKDDG